MKLSSIVQKCKIFIKYRKKAVISMLYLCSEVGGYVSRRFAHLVKSLLGFATSSMCAVISDVQNFVNKVKFK